MASKEQQSIDPYPGSKLATGQTIGMAIVHAPCELSDESLAVAARAGDRTAFSTLVQRYRGIAFSYALVRLGNREEAEDAAQEAFVRAFVSLPRFRLEGSWSAWLMRILRNLCHDAARRRSIRKTDLLDEGIMDISPSAENQLMKLADWHELRAALGTLPEKYRTPLMMHYSAGRTRKEVALALGIPESTVVGRLAGALRILRRRLVERPL